MIQFYRLCGMWVTALLLAFSASAKYVLCEANASGSNNGSSWTNAFTDLQSAIGIAVSGDHVWVAVGTGDCTAIKQVQRQIIRFA
ncbi:hypothetical protein KK083_11965 [Fulvivirgaceae bacterium PWU4]|uniref:Uncharacterized protein n=1 Tax=Chryseosolibacter histidini TaxID=2782349 RepID=A0AAP2GPM3_9BACT|nr:hypothetical protein [Chryseosolibacter histidini]MBT1697597.1 hypothetical protein [Chryseosolibacter histidini]